MLNCVNIPLILMQLAIVSIQCVGKGLIFDPQKTYDASIEKNSLEEI